MEVDTSDLPPLAATLFHPATNSVDFDYELELQKQDVQLD